jgi:hypothetical protein
VVLDPLGFIARLLALWWHGVTDTSGKQTFKWRLLGALCVWSWPTAAYRCAKILKPEHQEGERQLPTHTGLSSKDP